MHGSRTILGIDPGTHRLGYGLIRASGLRIEMLTYGCIEPTGPLEPADRLVVLYDQLVALMKEHKPDQVAVEELYFVKNVTTALRVAEARGVILLAARQQLIHVAEYKPTAIKAAVTGHGQAPKQQMQRMVQLLLKLPTLPRPDDAADGLAIAICHSLLGRHLPYPR